MAVTSLYPRFQSGDEWVQFDAVLEDSLEFKVDYTQFPIEIGANATDHGIIRPTTQIMTVAVGNRELGFNIRSNVAGFVSNLVDSAIVSTIAGLSGAFLDSQQQSRAKATLEFFVTLMKSRTPFDVDSVDIVMQNMVITRLGRVRDRNNEDGLVLVVEMQELPLLSTTITSNQPSQSQLNSNDTASTQAAAEVNKGEVLTKDANESTNAMVEAIA